MGQDNVTRRKENYSNNIKRSVGIQYQQPDYIILTTTNHTTIVDAINY